MKQKLIWLAITSLAFLFNACSSDSDSSSSPDNPSNPGISSSSGGEGGGSANPSPSTGVMGTLPTNADVNIPVGLYSIWKEFHYTTMEAEQTVYPTLAAEFGEIFGAYTAAGMGAARIVWQASDMSECKVDDATVLRMRKRGCTVSEGIGYGMLITVMQDDMEAFNRLWVYSKAYRESAYSGGNGLMPWLVTSFTWDVGDNSSATDADLDIATSLIIAYYKTGIQDYLNDAVALATAIWNHEINPATNLIYSGDTPMWKTADPTYNLSYFSPVALRLFAKVDPTHNWMGVLDAQYAYMQKVQAAGTGVFPDWSNGAGMAVNPNNGSADKTYWTFNKESVRIPWRIAWDYYWFQDDRAAGVLNTLQQFIASRSENDPAKIPAVNYSWNLDIGADDVGSKVSSQWLGAWCLTGMAGAQAWLDACTAQFNATPMQTTNTSYFSNILQMMYSQLLNGLYIKPAAL